MDGDIRNKTILIDSTDSSTWEKPTFCLSPLFNGLPSGPAIDELPTTISAADGTERHLLWLTSLTIEVSPLVQEVSSSAPFSKVYKLNNSLKSFSLNLVVRPDSGFIKKMFEFFQRCGSVAVRKNSAVAIKVANYSIYGWVMSKHIVISPRSAEYVTFSVTVLGFEYGN